MRMELFWAMIRPSSTKESIAMGIFKFFKCFSRICKNRLNIEPIE